MRKLAGNFALAQNSAGMGCRPRASCREPAQGEQRLATGSRGGLGVDAVDAWPRQRASARAIPSPSQNSSVSKEGTVGYPRDAIILSLEPFVQLAPRVHTTHQDPVIPPKSTFSLTPGRCPVHDKLSCRNLIDGWWIRHDCAIAQNSDGSIERLLGHMGGLTRFGLFWGALRPAIRRAFP